MRGQAEVEGREVVGLGLPERLQRVPQAEFCFVLDLTLRSSHSAAPRACVFSVPHRFSLRGQTAWLFPPSPFPPPELISMPLGFGLEQSMLGICICLILNYFNFRHCSFFLVSETFLKLLYEMSKELILWVYLQKYLFIMLIFYHLSSPPVETHRDFCFVYCYIPSPGHSRSSVNMC